jgi:hypothetical protein
MIHSRFYDSVLTELQTGNVQHGITLLVGMLDTVSDDAAALDKASEVLKEHDLWQILLHEPLCAHAAAVPHSNYVLGDILCEDNGHYAKTTTGVRLFDVTSELTFSRAFRERRKHASEVLIRAWQSGQKICLPSCSDFGALSALKGQDLSNICVADDNLECLEKLKSNLGQSINVIQQPAISFLHHAANMAQKFDLICAIELPDDLNQDALTAHFTAMRGALASGGKILSASILPDHIGSGWRQACLDWTIHCHSEAQIEAAASAAGLSICTYRDAADCVVWAECKIAELTAINIPNGSSDHGC